MVNLSEGQDKKIGDGTTSVVVLTASLWFICSLHVLIEVRKLFLSLNVELSLILFVRDMELLFIIHSRFIFYFLTVKILEELTLPVPKDKESLIKMGITPLNSKFVSKEKEKLASLCVDAVLLISGYISKFLIE